VGAQYARLFGQVAGWTRSSSAAELLNPSERHVMPIQTLSAIAE
jgi:hypothetical protein